MLNRLLSHPIFFIAMKLYDTPEDNQQLWDLRMANFCQSITILSHLILDWLVMKPWLSSVLPQWIQNGCDLSILSSPLLQVLCNLEPFYDFKS